MNVEVCRKHLSKFVLYYCCVWNAAVATLVFISPMLIMQFAVSFGDIDSFACGGKWNGRGNPDAVFVSLVNARLSGVVFVDACVWAL